jgi:hypothetical protein
MAPRFCSWMRHCFYLRKFFLYLIVAALPPYQLGRLSEEVRHGVVSLHGQLKGCLFFP